MRHLRNSSNYLAPGGLLEKMRIPTLMLWVILANFILFLPSFMLAVVFTEFAYELRGKTKLTQLIWFARIDVGVQIDIDLRDLSKDAPGFSRKSRALGYHMINRLMREEPEIVTSLWPDLHNLRHSPKLRLRTPYRLPWLAMGSVTTSGVMAENGAPLL